MNTQPENIMTLPPGWPGRGIKRSILLQQVALARTPELARVDISGCHRNTLCLSAAVILTNTA